MNNFIKQKKAINVVRFLNNKQCNKSYIKINNSYIKTVKIHTNNQEKSIYKINSI